MRKTILLVLAVCLSTAAAVNAATVFPRSDRNMLQISDLVVVGSALTSYTQFSPEGVIETVTPFSIEEVIKGAEVRSVINIHELGGRIGDQVTYVPGMPHFVDGERVLLFLLRIGKGDYGVTDIATGKYRFADDVMNRKVIVREMEGVDALDQNFQPVHEMHRSAAEFLDFLRTEARGEHTPTNYLVPADALIPADAASRPLRPADSSVRLFPHALFTASSYMLDCGGGQGCRWNVFPTGVNIFASSANRGAGPGEPGASGNGTIAVQAGINGWDNDAGSNINYVYAGTDATHTNGLSGAIDGFNTVQFEVDLTGHVPTIARFACPGDGSFSGVLGIGGIKNTVGTHTFNGQTFFTTTEVDVDMNQGIANCNALLVTHEGDWNSGVAHELGHTLGLRHADQTRDGGAACNTMTDDCAFRTGALGVGAIMTSFVTFGLNATPATWDRNAVDAIYPTPPCTPPAITVQPVSQKISRGSGASLSVTATGTGPLTYQWYVGNSGDTSTPSATGNPVSANPMGTTKYWVRVSNACGSADSLTATVTVIPQPVWRNSDFDNDGRTDLTIWRPSNGVWYTIKTSDGLGMITPWGLPGDKPVPGDYDGDGKTDVAIWRPSNGIWYVIQSSNGAANTYTWGVNGDIPVPADYDGDGKTDFAIFRPSTGQWYIINSHDGSGRLEQWGVGGDVPVPGDYDGDGKADIAVWRPSNGTWYIINSHDQSGTFQIWGANGDTPVPADYDGDGKTDLAIFRPPGLGEPGANGTWYIINSKDGSAHIEPWGFPTDIMVPADYDGDGKADIAVWRPANGTWYIINSSAPTTATIQLWGVNGDVPTPRRILSASTP